MCPGGVVTGGPELLHQLVHELRALAIDARICYHPFNKEFSVPEQYVDYNVLQGVPEDSAENILILPESATKIARRYKFIKVAIWWQSVDNYYQLPKQMGWRKLVPVNIASYFGRLPIRKMSGFLHYTQSEYARLHLKSHGIESKMLGDYLAGAHDSVVVGRRKNAVAYNPKKGMAISKVLIEALPSVEFIAIENMSPKEVHVLLSSVKVYMDFGNHPGKDRMPREAALAGACVITGMRGAAKNEIDIPIKSRYKILENENMINTFSSVVFRIFSDYQMACGDFDEYRQVIRLQRKLFADQCADLFSR